MFPAKSQAPDSAVRMRCAVSTSAQPASKRRATWIRRVGPRANGVIQRSIGAGSDEFRLSLPFPILSSMLKSHQNLLSPRPSDRLRIGDCVVDLSLREIVRDAPGLDAGGESIRITVKAQGVLMALVAHAGKVVGREALLEWVWPDTMPNDDVVTQAVTLLRKAFGDSRDQNAYIETIAKHGYRLVAPVEWILPEQTTPLTEQSTVARSATEPSAVQARRRPSRRSIIAWTATFAGLGAIVAALWLSRPVSVEISPGNHHERTVLEPAYVRIASSPEPEYGPTLSPDGSMLAYVRYPSDGASLYLQTATALPPTALTERQPGRDDLMPAWSPNGHEIAFQRRTATHCTIMLMAATGGSEREIGECLDGEAHQIAWYPDGQALIAAGSTAAVAPEAQTGHGAVLYRMAIAEGRWRPIPYTRAAHDIDEAPAVSPDGRWIAFHRNAALGDLWRMPVGGGAPQRLTHLETNIYGLAWTADSKAVVFSRMVDGEKRLSRVDIDSGHIVDFALNDGGFEYPSVAFNSGAIAFQIEEEDSRLQRLSLQDGPQAHARWQTAYDTSRSNRLPSVAPDGEQIVFASDRSAEERLWWAVRAQPDSLRPIEGFTPAPRFAPVWDAASRRLLAVGEGAQGTGLYEIDPQHGRVARLPVPEIEPTYAIYHPDPRRLLVIGSHGDGLLGLFLFDRSVNPWRVVASVEGDIGVATVDRANARVVYVLRTKPEIWAADLALAHPHQVDALEKRGRGRLKTLTAAADGVWLLDGRPDCVWHLRRVARTLGEPLPGAQCLGGNPNIPLEGGSYDPKHRELYLGIRDYPVHDIGLLSPQALKDKIEYLKTSRN
ncbi:MAG: hypothetical protein E6Q88_12655 [Lysobacteraceae bacterium]|nr:MAG: hypothetical protein E6Q88_12655 [Xanthomonadaceae bacterium]